MSVSRTIALGKVARAAAGLGRGADTDRELLRRFARNDDQAAFEALVRRHAGMVLGVCRRSLPTLQDAEDACQATFVVLARRAGAGRWNDSVTNWLYTTARRVAQNARVAADRRAKREERAAVPEAVEPVDRMTGRELLAALDAALDRLPSAYREPLVLCYLEGLTHDEAAARLGVPRGTLGTRVDRGRKRLHAALVRAGLAPGAGLLALAAAGPSGAASPRLVGLVLAAVSGPAPVAVDALAKGVAGPGALSATALALAAVAGAAVLAAGLISVAPSRAAVAPRAEPPAAPKAEPAPQPADAKPPAARVEVKGRVVGPDDKSVAGAKLFLQTGNALMPAPQAVAGDDGSFHFTLDEARRDSTVVATAPGHGLAWAYVPLHPLPELSLRLTPDEPIRGKVVNLEGKPVAGVSVSVVTVYQPREDKTLDRWLKVARDLKSEDRVALDPIRDYLTGFAGLLEPATSDRDGKFELRGLGRDRVATLRVTGPTTATHQLAVVTRKVEQFTGGFLFPAHAETLHGSEPVVTATPVPVTTGQVLDDAGKPVPGAVLWLDRLSHRAGPNAHSGIQDVRTVAGRDGRFTLPGVPTGDQRVQVVVVPPDGTPFHRIYRTIPDDAAARGAFDIELTRGIPATVKVIDKTTRLPVKSQLRYGVFPDENPNAKALANVWHWPEWARGPYHGVTESEFRIVVFPGKGLLAAHAARDWWDWWRGRHSPYLSGVGVEAFERYRRDDQLLGLAHVSNLYIPGEHTLAAIDVPADAKEFAFTLELDRGLTAPIRLTDADGKPVAGAESYGLDNAMAAGGAWAEPAAGAAFTSLALRVGEKRRVMFVHHERKLAGSAVAVGGTKEPVEVRMAPWGEAKGRIVDADGKTAVGRIDLLHDVIRQTDLALGSSPLYSPRAAGPETDKDGRFRVTGLVPGLTYRWVARRWKVGETVLPDTVAKAGEVIDLGDIVVRPK